MDNVFKSINNVAAILAIIASLILAIYGRFDIATYEAALACFLKLLGKE